MNFRFLNLYFLSEKTKLKFNKHKDQVIFFCFKKNLKK
jgi:hypothetical protein